MAPLYPQDDADAITLARGLTQYEDDVDELTQSEFETQLRLAKMRLKTKTGSSDWYSVDGLGQALVGTTAILAKTALENYSVTSWNLGVGAIDVSGAGDEDTAQFSQWADMVADGLSDSGFTEGTATNINSAAYIG